MDELSHAIMGVAIRTADAALFDDIQAAYKAAMAKGLYKGHYAATNARMVRRRHARADA